MLMVDAGSREPTLEPLCHATAGTTSRTTPQTLWTGTATSVDPELGTADAIWNAGITGLSPTSTNQLHTTDTASRSLSAGTTIRIPTSRGLSNPTL